MHCKLAKLCLPVHWCISNCYTECNICVGRIYVEKTAIEKLPGICGILAAGNHLVVAIRDTLYHLFEHHRLAVIKMVRLSPLLLFEGGCNVSIAACQPEC